VREQVREQVWNQVGNQVEVIYESFSSYCNYSDFGWLSFYDFFLNETPLIQDYRNELEMMFDVVKYSFMQIQLEGFCIVSKYPSFISRNTNNELHNTRQGAVKFQDGYCQYYVNGRSIDQQTFEKSQTIEGARECFFQTNNEDIKACIITIIKENFGNTGLMEMLNATLVSETTVNHENNYKETIRIYKTKDNYSFLMNSKGETNQPYAWLELTCPSTGSVYLIDTCPTFTDPVECAKWHRPSGVPENLPYIWQSAN
jgi:hypothetical protein